MSPADPPTSPAPATLEAARAAIDGVEGWLSEDQVARLHAAARSVRPGGRIVEIGSFRGRSAIVLALAAPDAEVVAIDPHAGNDRGPQELDGFEEAAAEDHRAFLANLERAGVADRVRHVRSFSSEALDEVRGPIDLLYVDGAHRYGPARDDLRRWGRRVVPDGALLVHDAFSSIGVTLALLRTMLGSATFAYVGRSRSLAEYRASGPGPMARLRSAGRQVLQLGWFARNVVVKALLVCRLGRLARLLGHDGETWPY